MAAQAATHYAFHNDLEFQGQGKKMRVIILIPSLDIVWHGLSVDDDVKFLSARAPKTSSVPFFRL